MLARGHVEGGGEGMRGKQVAAGGPGRSGHTAGGGGTITSSTDAHKLPFSRRRNGPLRRRFLLRPVR